MEKTSLAERRAALLQAGAQVSRNVISILDPDELLQKTVDIICEEFGFYYAGVFLLDEEKEWAVLQSGRGDAGAAMVAEGHKLHVGGLSMIGAATGRNQALIALDVGDEPVHFKNPHLPLTRSEMALPLSVGSEVIGALTVQSIEEAAFSDDDITALQAMADQLAIAINNARLYSMNRILLSQTTRRARLLEASTQVAKGITSILDLDELLHETVDVICEAYGFYYAGVFLLDETNEWAVLRAGYGEAGSHMVELGHQLRIGGLSMIGTAIAERHARIALDVGDEPVHFKNPHLPLTRSEMALPLVVGNKVIGAVTVQSVEESAFSDEDISSLQAMADQLAIALDNARLLRELEAAHSELVRTKTFEALATSTIEAIHWIGNKALPMTASVDRLCSDLEDLQGVDEEIKASMREDLAMVRDNAQLIVAVQEHLIGPARDNKPLPAMIDDVVKDLLVKMQIPSDIITYEPEASLPLAVADTTQLSRSLGYILQNALDATEGQKDRQIKVVVEPRESKGLLYVAINIANNGPSIPESELDKIWAAFYTTKGAKHAGLGLSATLQIMKQLDGQVAVKNLSDGGVEFEVLVPVIDSKYVEATLPVGQSVLLIDDDDSWSRFVTETLTEAGNKVDCSLDTKNYAKYDWVFVDDALESGDTMKVLSALSKAQVSDKVYVCASNMRVERVMDLMRYGIKDVLLKPYTVEALAKIFSD